MRLTIKIEADGERAKQLATLLAGVVRNAAAAVVSASGAESKGK